ncbi:MAG: hypothetical protein ABIO80_01605 [Sphingomicrobium sp.]
MTCCDDFAGSADAPEQTLHYARTLLEKALNLLDVADAPGHLGARLQHVIDGFGD